MSCLRDRDPIYGLHEDDSDFETLRSREEPLFLLNELGPDTRQRAVEKLEAFDKTGLFPLGLMIRRLVWLLAQHLAQLIDRLRAQLIKPYQAHTMGDKRPYQTFLLEHPEEPDHHLYQTVLRRQEPRAKVRRFTQPYTSSLLPRDVYPGSSTEKVTVLATDVVREHVDHELEGLCDVSGHWLFEDRAEGEDDHEGWWDVLSPELFKGVVEQDCEWDSEGWSNWTPPSTTACSRRSSLSSSCCSSVASSVCIPASGEEGEEDEEEVEEEDEAEVANEAADDPKEQRHALERDPVNEACERWVAKMFLLVVLLHIERYPVREVWMEWSSLALLLTVAVYEVRQEWKVEVLLGWGAAAVLLPIVVHRLFVWIFSC
ncbi:hypothetical protein MBLNU457_6255t1 [Dothideomycetes sp. NU457]